MQRLRHNLWAVVAAVVLASCAATDGQPVDTEPTATPLPTAPSVARERFAVQRGNVEEVLEFTGRWQPRDQFQLSFPIDGTVRRVEVQERQAVSQGELLADLQIEELEEQLEDAERALEVAVANAATEDDTTVSSVESAELELFNAQLALQRYLDDSPEASTANELSALEDAREALEEARDAYAEAIAAASQGGGGGGGVDGARDALEQAEEAVADAEIAYAQSAAAAGNTIEDWDEGLIDVQNSVTLAEDALADAREEAAGGVSSSDITDQQITVDRLQEDINQSTLSSPIDGVVTLVEVRPGDQVTAFTPVITVGAPDPKEIIAQLAAADANRLEIGQLGRCQLNNQPETAVQCVIRYIPADARSEDQSTRVAASLEDVAQDNQIIQVFMPLQTQENVLWLPPRFLSDFQSRTFVVLETEEGPRTADVEIGLRTDERVEIISGVDEGDIVIAP